MTKLRIMSPKQDPTKAENITGTEKERERESKKTQKLIVKTHKDKPNHLKQYPNIDNISTYFSFIYTGYFNHDNNGGCYGKD